MERYSVIAEKNPREIVLLRGSGCQWRKCSFCDYHLDFSKDEAANFELNRSVLEKVTGKYGRLEVINSGSFCDLDKQTRFYIRKLCREKGISSIHFECHWMHRQQVPALREEYEKAGIHVKVKIGVESFEREFRENIMRKGIDESNPAVIAKNFNEVCLLFGLTGQTAETMLRDVETGLAYFERVCINIMVENTTKVRPDKSVIEVFMEKIYPKYRENARVDILLNNTDFGVGE